MKRGFLKSSKEEVIVRNMNVFTMPNFKEVTGNKLEQDLSPALKLLLTPKDMKHDTLVTITVPAHQDDPDGCSQVLIRPSNAIYTRLITQAISLIPHPPFITYRIATTPKMGKGMFATRRLAMGDLIASERPFIVAPVMINRPVSSNNEASVIVSLSTLFEDLLRNLFIRMSPEQQDAFNQLSNSHPDDRSHSLLGIVRTNGMEVDLSADTSSEQDPRDSYVGICNDISRCNHSCTPNAYFIFDLKTFSFQLHAMRPIATEEEITISYTPVAEPCKERAKDMAPYSFRCQCFRCSNPEQSDLDLKKIQTLSQRLPEIMALWRSDLTATREITDVLHGYIEFIQEKGLESISEYKSILSALYIIAVERGDERVARKWGSLLIDRIRAEMPVGRESSIPRYNDPDVFKEYSSWDCRGKKQVNTVYMELL